MKKFLFLAYTIALAAVVAGISYSAHDSFVPTGYLDYRDSLPWVRSYLQVFDPVYDYMAVHPKVAYQYGGYFVSGILALFALLMLLSKKFTGSLLTMAFGAGAFAQSLILQEAFQAGIAVYALSCLILISYLALSKTSAKTPESSKIIQDSSASQKNLFLLLELGAFAAITSIVIIFRFHRLNTYPPYWDDELCYFRAISTVLKNFVESDFLITIPASTLGFLWGVLHKYAGEFFGHNIFSERIISAAISIAISQFLYLLLRSHFNAFCALIGTVCYMFGPTDLGMSRLPSYHNLPVLIVILCVLTTIKYLKEPTKFNFLLVLVSATTTNIVYPSGTFGFLIPVLAMLFFTGLSLKQRRIKAAAILFAGSVAITLSWTLLKSVIGYFFLGVAAFRSPMPAYAAVAKATDPYYFTFLNQVSENISYFIKSFYFKEGHPDHWCPLTTFLPGSPVSAVVAVLGTAGFLIAIRKIKQPVCAVLLVWVAIGLLPGAVSEGMAVRRVATVYPAFAALSAVALNELYEIFRGYNKYLTGIIFSAAFLVISSVHFLSHAAYFKDKLNFIVPEETAAALISRKIIPEEKTLIISFSPFRRNCQIFYSLYDLLDINNGSVGWGSPKDDEDMLSYVRQPRSSADTWYYQYTELAYQQRTVLNEHEWDKIIYAVEENENYQKQVEALKLEYPQAEFSEFRRCPVAGICKLGLFTIDKTETAGSPVSNDNQDR